MTYIEHMAERSIAKQVFDWIRERPYIIYALKKDLINFSSLSRMIQKDLDIGNFDAVIIAARRFQNEITALKTTGQETINFLKKSRLEIKTGVNVYTLKSYSIENLEKIKYLHLIKGSNTVTIITEEKLNIDSIIKRENMVQVKITSLPEVQESPGFLAYICLALTERGINIFEDYSCYTDTMFIFNKSDLQKVVEALSAIGIE